MQTFENKLAAFAKLVCRIHTKIEGMSGAELLDLQRACKQPTDTNCWWATKRTADLIAPIVQAERAHRRGKK